MVEDWDGVGFELMSIGMGNNGIWVDWEGWGHIMGRIP